MEQVNKENNELPLIHFIIIAVLAVWGIFTMVKSVPVIMNDKTGLILLQNFGLLFFFP